MNIGIFTDTWLPTRDGVVTSILAFRKEIMDRGHKFFLFVPSAKNKDDYDEGIFYYKSAPFKPYPNYRRASLADLWNERTVQLVKKMDIDIIHSHSPAIMGMHAIISSRKLKLPLLFTYHTSLEDSLHYVSSNDLINDLIKPLLWKWLKWYFRRCDAIIVPSIATARELVERTGTNSFIVPTGIELDRFSRANGRKVRKKIDENKKVVLHVGRIVKEKNLELLIKAAHFLDPDIIFLIVGEGPAEKEIKSKISRIGLTDRFIFAGFVPDEKLPEYYKCADAFAFPSTYETQGIVALEAMASGLPVAAANYRSLPEIIKDGENGFLFDPTNDRECANSIMKAIEAENSIKENARKTAEKYSIAKCTDRLISVYKEIINKS
jgi:1,2-diacylglycerol 3-alpha-glucosyltransferase